MQISGKPYREKAGSRLILLSYLRTGGDTGIPAVRGQDGSNQVPPRGLLIPMILALKGP